ncbi:coatomer gamma subunit [Angomonas deanei]|nr:coatomer gamma subunit [Angomonas deanei]|eukprot:EPY37516.1 coatomer gamma subunit [Angomonas deanei]
MKELAPLVPESFIASNSLMVDIKNGNDSVKSNAIRTLYAVMDNTMYSALDRTIVECMNSRSPLVVNAALVTGLHVAHVNPDMPKKWATQITEVMKDRSKAQYPAIALLHRIRKNDRLSVMRMIEQAKDSQIRSPLALCLLIKLCTELMQEDFDNSLDIYRFVSSLTQHNSDLVMLEAVKSICSLRNITDKEVSPAVMVLHLYLSTTSNYNAVSMFAALSQLSQVATTHPAAVSPLNDTLETLVLNPNRVIATLAITTLLKTGTEKTIDRLIAPLTSSNYFSSLGDEFKAVIVDAMRVLNAKFPSKYSVLLSFLFKALQDDGSAELKKCIIDTMMDIASANPSSNDVVLTHLANYIDDCEFPAVTKSVLMHLAEEVPHCANPKKYVRLIYNQATLEQAEVRAVAITTLAKLAARVPSLRPSICQLLKRSCSDRADQVRDRAHFYYKLLLSNDEGLIKALVTDVAKAVQAHRLQHIAEKQQKVSAVGKSDSVDVQNVPVAEGPASGERGASAAVQQGREQLRKIQQLRELGEPIYTQEPVALTDADSEYVVAVLKHCYAEHVVLQFRVKNTMDGVSFRRVAVLCNTDELEVEPLYAIPIECVEPGATGYSYVVLQYSSPEYPSGTVESTFRFAMTEEGDEEGEEDEYPLESFDVDVKDFIAPVDFGSQFEKMWEAAQDKETTGTYALSSMRNVTAAVHAVAEFFGMFVQGGVPEKITTPSHVLLMSGTVCDASRTVVLVQARVFVTQDNAVGLQLSLRGGEAELREYLNAAC